MNYMDCLNQLHATTRNCQQGRGDAPFFHQIGMGRRFLHAAVFGLDPQPVLACGFQDGEERQVRDWQQGTPQPAEAYLALAREVLRWAAA